MSYLKSFVIGSSFPVFILFFIAVRKISNNIKNYKYEDYTLIAPLYLGLMNMISLYLTKYFNLNVRTRYLIIGIISPLIVITFARLNNSYNYDNTEWTRYSIYLMMKHFLIFNFIIYNIESSVDG